MKIACLMPARNEAWCLGLTARAALMWCDELIILNHASTDETGQIAEDLLDRYSGVTLLEERDPEWSEMAHRERLLRVAREHGATHIVTIDADELVTGHLIPHMRNMIEGIPDDALLQLPWVNLRGSIHEYHCSGQWGRAWVSTAFKDSPELHWTSATRGGYDFHHRHPMGREVVPCKPVPLGYGGLMHLQMVSDRRLRAKQALYKMTELIRWPNREPVRMVDERYNPAVYGSYAKPPFPHDLKRIPAIGWTPYAGLMQYLDVDRAPWQEVECRRLWTEHGAARFVGLDLFGVIE